jgi:hypothetical protein
MKKLAGIAVVCAFFGCARGAGNEEPKASESGGSEQAQAATPALPLADKGGDCCQSCPLALQGVKLDYAEFGGGASMVFVTADKSEEEELRRRVAELAAYHNRNGDKLAMLNHPHHADVKPIEGGARIDLTPDSGFNMQSGFNREVEREVKWMQDGQCPPLGESNDCVSCDLPSR